MHESPSLCGGGKPAAFEHATIHATCLVVGESGVLIRGDSGAGKSSLALALIERAALRGLFAGLVGDDRIRLATFGGRVVARPHPAIAGRIEVRGYGIVTLDSVEACVLRLVVDLVATAARVPELPRDAVILGVPLPCLRIDRGTCEAGLGPGLVLAGLGVSSQSHTPPCCGEAACAP